MKSSSNSSRRHVGLQEPQLLIPLSTATREQPHQIEVERKSWEENFT